MEKKVEKGAGPDPTNRKPSIIDREATARVDDPRAEMKKKLFEKKKKRKEKQKKKATAFHFGNSKVVDKRRERKTKQKKNDIERPSNAIGQKKPGK